MSERSLRLSKTTFAIKKPAAFLVQGPDLEGVTNVSLSSTDYAWVEQDFDHVLNGRALLVSAMPRYIEAPDPKPRPGTLLFGDLTVTLTSAGGTCHTTLHVPAFYVAP